MTFVLSAGWLFPLKCVNFFWSKSQMLNTIHDTHILFEIINFEWDGSESFS